MAKWGGWIPTLSGDVFIVNLEDSLKREGYKREDHGRYYGRYIKISDIFQEEKVFFRIYYSGNINNLAKFKVKISNKVAKNQSYCEGECEVCQNGFFTVKCKLDKSLTRLEDRFASEIYQRIRDIYHQHTHHHKENKELLFIVKSGNKKEVVQNLIKQYQQKILDYHHGLRELVASPSFRRYIVDLFEDFLKLFSFLGRFLNLKLFSTLQASFPSKTTFPSSYSIQAQGEMIYAKMVVQLFKDDIPNNQAKDFLQVFDYAYCSLGDIREEIGRIYQDYTNKLLVGLTSVLAILTIVLLCLS